MQKSDDFIKANYTEASLTWLTLFTTIGTLLCCAIPIILVTLGMGATVASMMSTLPFLVPLSEYKIWMFLISAVILILSAWMLFRPSSR